MSLLRDRIYRLIDQLADDELVETWAVLAELYGDLYMLRAIVASKKAPIPGDSFTRDEALQVLPHI